MSFRESLSSRRRSLSGLGGGGRQPLFLDLERFVKLDDFSRWKDQFGNAFAFPDDLDVGPIPERPGRDEVHSDRQRQLTPLSDPGTPTPNDRIDYTKPAKSLSKYFARCCRPKQQTK